MPTGNLELSSKPRAPNSWDIKKQTKQPVRKLRHDTYSLVCNLHNISSKLDKYFAKKDLQKKE